MSTSAPHRFTLRQLPLPAKVVVTVFLFAVGLGYVSAMVQLHDKHSSKEGEPLPTPADVVEVFAGLKKPDPNAPPPCSRIDTLLCGDKTANDVSKDNMAPAFFAKSKGWDKESAPSRRDPRGPAGVSIQELREGELNAMLAWVRGADPTAKQAAYEADKFTLPTELQAKPITPEFLTANKELKIKSLIDARCQNCHKDQPPELGTYAGLEPLVNVPSQELIDGKWVRSSRQVGKEKLIQSTHAHLLTFAILFALTGLVFAFTGYPSGVRLFLAPVVLIAQVADVGCWWLARTPAPYGPLFATAIIGTGTVVGLGLVLQIFLSLLSMYATRGKMVMLVLMAVVGGGLAYVGLKVIQPALDEEKAAALKVKTTPPPVKPDGNGGPPKQVDPPKVEVSHLERLIMGSRDTKVAPWNGKGSMARAFFEQENKFKKLKAKNDPELPKVEAEREGERLAIQAWIHSEPAARKAAYEADKFELPAPLQGKPLTGDYADGKAAKVKSIINDRCANCHAEGAEQDKFPLEKYDEILKYIDPVPAGGAGIPKAKE